MAPCLDTLVALYGQALKSGAAARLLAAGADGPAAAAAAVAAGAGGAPRLEEEDVAAVIEGAALCVTRCVPEQQLLAGGGLQSLLGPILEPLAAAVTAFPPTPASAAPLRDKLPLVDRLAALLLHLDSPPVAAEALRRAWPVLDAAMTAALGSDEGLERVCRALRRGVKAAGLAGQGVLPALLQSLPARYQQVRCVVCGCCVWLLCVDAVCAVCVLGRVCVRRGTTPNLIAT